MLIHPQEGMLQEARALQQSAAYDEYRARRVAVEHRLARLVQLGIRQSRYFGRVKTRFQLYLAATVANLTLVAGKIGLSDSVGGGAEAHRVVLSAVPSDVQAVSHGVVANATAIFGAVRLGILWTVILLKPALLPKSLSPTRAFSARFLGAVILESYITIFSPTYSKESPKFIAFLFYGFSSTFTTIYYS